MVKNYIKFYYEMHSINGIKVYNVATKNTMGIYYIKKRISIDDN